MGASRRLSHAALLHRAASALQNGRFDAPDRLFWSIADTWKSVLALPSDVKELVPEFYSNDPSFLVRYLVFQHQRRAAGCLFYGRWRRMCCNAIAETACLLRCS